MNDEQKTVWVVEDDGVTQMLHTAFMEGAGYRVVEFNTVDAALAALGYDNADKKIHPPEGFALPYAVVTDNRPSANIKESN